MGETYVVVAAEVDISDHNYRRGSVNSLEAGSTALRTLFAALWGLLLGILGLPSRRKDRHIVHSLYEQFAVIQCAK